MSKNRKHQNDQTEATTPEVEAEPKVKKSTRLTEAQIIERYPHVITGTMQFETEGKHAGKQTVEATLECGHVQRVATSDLFQVKRCAECRKPVKRERKVKAEASEHGPRPSSTRNKPVLPAVSFIPADESIDALAEAAA